MQSTFNLQFTAVSPANAILSIDKQINNQHISWPWHSDYQPMMTALFSPHDTRFLNESTHHHASSDYDATIFVITRRTMRLGHQHATRASSTANGTRALQLHASCTNSSNLLTEADINVTPWMPVDLSPLTAISLCWPQSVGRKWESHSVFLVGHQMIHSVKWRTNHKK